MSRVRLLFAALVMLGVLGHGAVKASVPFKGTLDVSITGAGASITTAGSGNASHMGTVATAEELFINPDGSFTGTITFTAANGDQVACTLSGQFVSATAAAGEYVISGGTGRFSDASGGASFNVSMTSASTFRVNFHGDISY